MLKIICVYKQQVLPIWKDKDKYYCVFIKEDIHRSQHPVCNSSLDKILELYKDHIDTSKYITSEDYDLELEVNYKDEVRNYYNLPSADDTITKFINQVDNENMKTLTIKDIELAYNLDPEEYFKKKMQENTRVACNTLVKQILKDFPNSADNLCDLLLDFKYKLEEGVGQKK